MQVDPTINNNTSSENTSTPPIHKKDHPILSIILAIILAVMFRSFAYEPFNIPSGSMKPNLWIGDYIFVSKYSYGYSRYSFPFGWPVFEGRIMADAPEQGDVVVFKLPTDPSINYIKRLIGMPGDKIQMIAGTLHINGQAISKELVEPYREANASGEMIEIPQYKETLPNGVSYFVLDEQTEGPLDSTVEYVVPENHYFMMGDNRDNSQDSRVLSVVGYVPEENLVGPAQMIFFSSRSALWKIWDFRSERYFKKIEYK